MFFVVKSNRVFKLILSQKVGDKTNILSNKIKKVCYKIVFINIYILFNYYVKSINNDFLKIFNNVGKKMYGLDEIECALGNREIWILTGQESR